MELYRQTVQQEIKKEEVELLDINQVSREKRDKLKSNEISFILLMQTPPAFLSSKLL